MEESGEDRGMVRILEIIYVFVLGLTAETDDNTIRKSFMVRFRQENGGNPEKDRNGFGFMLIYMSFFMRLFKMIADTGLGMELAGSIIQKEPWHSFDF